jgi:putative Mn2+ efflux pump MntP
LLIATGGYAVWQAIRGQARHQHQPAAEGNRPRTGQLVITGIALSVDNLAIGFALGAYHVNLAAAAVIIGAVSVTLSLAGLELGGRLGARPASEVSSSAAWSSSPSGWPWPAASFGTLASLSA